MRNCFYLLCSLTLVLSCPRSSFAATINAASPSASDVQAAINQALNDDTVVVPAGSATWATSVSIANKSITLTGAGIGQTIITRNTATISAPALSVALRNSPKDFLNLSGFTWLTINQPQTGIVNVGVSNANGNPLVQFRITNCKFVSGGSGSRSLQIGGVWGLVDHCTFLKSSAGGESISLLQDSAASTVNTWHTPQVLGDQNAVYMEDNSFTAVGANDSAIDCYVGMKLVFRHNNCVNCGVGWHGYDSSYRSTRSFEVYNNVFTTTAGVTGQLGIYCRGGTGVVYSNTWDSGFAGMLGFLVYCSDHVFKRPHAFAPSAAWGSTAVGGGPGFVAPAGDTATGSNPVDGNSVGPGAVDQGYPVLDQPGRGSFPVGNPGNWPNVTTGYSNAVCETLDPVYQWNNVLGTNHSPVCGYNIATTSNYVKPNRDYYDNVQKPNYTPLQYPHPLTQSGSPLAAPKNLTVVPN
jgi:hypothetical protein